MTIAEILHVLQGERPGDVWWAYQLRPFHETAREGGYLWTLLNPREGVEGYEALKPGDVLLHYAYDRSNHKAIIGVSGVRSLPQETPKPDDLDYPNQRARTPGLMVPIDYHQLPVSISADSIPLDWRITEGQRVLLNPPPSPFREDGTLRPQGLIHTVSRAFARMLVERFPASFPALTALPNAQASAQREAAAERTSEHWKHYLEVAQRDVAALEAEWTFQEGSPSVALVNKYERDPQARARAIEIHGTTCQACGFSFLQAYGPWGADFIEVHHLRPISTYQRQVDIDPRADLAVLCANCHRMVHRIPSHPLSLDELRELITANRVGGTATADAAVSDPRSSSAARLETN